MYGYKASDTYLLKVKTPNIKNFGNHGKYIKFPYEVIQIKKPFTGSTILVVASVLVTLHSVPKVHCLTVK